MFGFVLSLAVLSVMFSLLGGAAILYRRSFLKGREGLMYPMWIFILLLSIFPLRLDLPVYPEQSDTAAVLADEPSSDQSALSASLPEDDLITVLRPTGKGTTLRVLIGRTLSRLAANNQKIASIIFSVWIIGASIHFAFALNDYFQAKKLLMLSSEPCRERRMSRLLEESKQRLGVRRSIRLRMLDTAGLCSPCVCGCLRPTLFLEPGCRKLSDDELRYVLAHELTHIARCDMLLKLFNLFVTSIHWFNPTSAKLQKYFYEDCELSCDSNVLRIYGSGISGVYMTTIINFAERFSAQNRFCELSLTGGFFFAKTSSTAFLKKRYTSMKNYRKAPSVMLLTLLLAMLMGGTNILALSSFGSIRPMQLQGSLELSPSVERMLRAYYGLGEEDFITTEMLDRITTLEIIANKAFNGHILADFVVNGEGGYARAVPSLAVAGYWEGCIQPRLDSAIGNVPILSELNDASDSVYCLKVPYDHSLTERALEEQRLTYPTIREKGSLYVLSSAPSEERLKLIYSCFDSAGLLDDWMIDSEVFDASCLEYFGNIREITFVGFTPGNYEFPADVSVSEEPQI